jgi:hypothetical protein
MKAALASAAAPVTIGGSVELAALVYQEAYHKCGACQCGGTHNVFVDLAGFHRHTFEGITHT